MRAPLICVFLLVASSVDAQTIIDFQSTTFFQQSSGGKPATCGLEFVVIHRDLTNNGKNHLGISGSLTWNFSPGKFFTLLKVKGFDFPTAKAENKVPFRPASISMFIGDEPESIKASGQVDSEDNSLLAAYPAESASEIFVAINRTRRTTIAYNRKAGLYDVALPIDFKKNLDDQSWERFLSCMDALIKNAQKR